MAAAPGGGIERNMPSAGLMFAVMVERYRERDELHRDQTVERYIGIRAIDIGYSRSNLGPIPMTQLLRGDRRLLRAIGDSEIFRRPA